MKIGIFTPKNINNKSKEFEQAKVFIEDKGFKVYLGGLDKLEKNETTPIEVRASEINALLERRINILMASDVDESLLALLRNVRYSQWNRSKISICGSGALTPLLSRVGEKTKADAYYGPNFITGFSSENKEEIYVDFIDTIQNKKGEKGLYETGKNEDGSVFKTLKNDWIFEGSKKRSGLLVGGEVESLIANWDIGFNSKKIKGNIILLDDLSNDVKVLEKQISFLNEKNVFKNASAIIMGKQKEGNDIKMLKETIDQIVSKNTSKNILFGFDGQNSDKQLTLKLFAKTVIDFGLKTLTQNLK